jgi:hypothetical protein
MTLKMDSSETLYIIGNGFDLYHGLSTQYSDFSKYLHNYDKELLYMLESFIDSPELWSDFEYNLAKLHIESIIEHIEDLLPDIDSERDGDKYFCPDEAHRIIDMLTIGLRCKIRDWVLFASQFCVPPRFNLSKNGKFLSFNYTQTLENLYGINDVFHIHGVAEKSRFDPFKEDSKDIIFGHNVQHGKSMKKSKLSDKNDFNQIYAIEESYSEISQYWQKSFKDSKTIINSHKSFFVGLHDIKNIVIIGHSLSDVDLDYFAKIAYHAQNVDNWYITYYGHNESATIARQVGKFCNPSSVVNYIDLADDPKVFFIRN